MSNNVDKEAVVGDIGKVIRVYAGSKTSLASATSIIINVKKPTGVEVEWEATLDPSNNYYALYTTEEDDLDVAGTWLAYVQAVFPSGADISSPEIDDFEVKERFQV